MTDAEILALVESLAGDERGERFEADLLVLLVAVRRLVKEREEIHRLHRWVRAAQAAREEAERELRRLQLHQGIATSPA